MKNLKNIAAATTLTAVLMMGATTTKAGLLMSDRTATGVEQCTQQDDKSFLGLLISDLKGLLVSDRTGIMISDRTETSECQQEATLSGLLMSD